MLVRREARVGSGWIAGAIMVSGLISTLKSAGRLGTAPSQTSLGAERNDDGTMPAVEENVEHAWMIIKEALALKHRM